MLQLPAEWSPLMGEFVPLFSKPVWEHATILLVGAIVAPGTRTVTAGGRVMGLRQEQCFVTSHRGLHRARWSPLAARQLLLRVVVTRCALQGHGALAGMTPSSDGAAIRAMPKGAPAIRCVLLMALWSKRVGCDGAVVCGWAKFRGLVLCGECLS